MHINAGHIAMTVIAAGLAMSALTMPAGAQQTNQLANCDSGDRIDGTTAAQTKKKVEAAGFSQVRDLTKGCDNFWHGVAVSKDGTSINVLITPDGQVKQDGD